MKLKKLLFFKQIDNLHIFHSIKKQMDKYKIILSIHFGLLELY